jgi:hypothetical protein
VSSARKSPTPSDEVLIRLAEIVARTDELLTGDQLLQRAPVGLRTVKNDRRRTMEAILVLLADPEVRAYVAELEKQGLLPAKR